MSTTAQKPVTTPIPVQLSAMEFNELIVPVQGRSQSMASRIPRTVILLVL